MTQYECVVMRARVEIVESTTCSRLIHACKWTSETSARVCVRAMLRVICVQIQDSCQAVLCTRWSRGVVLRAIHYRQGHVSHALASDALMRRACCVDRLFV
jgi:hypothetical protein